MAKKVEEEYKKLSQNDHVLKRPGMYLGSIEAINKPMYISDDIVSVQKKDITYVPAFIKLFDEILTNASDHAIRSGKLVKNIKVSFTDDLSEISVYNDGPGIPVEFHKDENMYVPELIFGHLLSGSNFDDSEERFVGGMNGMGSVLVNLFSKKFIVDTADKKKHYYQVFDDNMTIVNKPIIKPSKESYTKITYFPDFKRLPLPYENGTNGQINNIKDTRDLIIKRCIDIAAYNLGVNVYVNDKKIDVKTLTDYINLHTSNENVFIETINENYTIAVTESTTDNFENISIVNGITTYIGGTHVNVITDQLVEEIKNKLVKGNKNIKIRNSDIKNKLMVFIICKLPNPVFDTQSKENLISKITNKPVISEKFIKQICNSSIIESIREWVLLKEQAELAKINKGKATNVRIAKLQDAHNAGTKDGYKCKLILCEGDSARSSAISGLSVVGTDYYGVFPLKGKPLNVREQSVSKITENEEITKIIKTLGLIIGKKYTSVAELRYGGVVFMTDADVDGSHIKGLLINLFHKYWPELLDLGFLYEFITPLVKVRKGKEVKAFYSMNDYTTWREKGETGWNIKYYKGLGTIMADEIKEMFKLLDKHLIKLKWNNIVDNDKTDLIFNKKRADERKTWLLNYAGEIVPEKVGKPYPIADFYDKEFIQFSMADNIRSIPDIMDGLKPSQRKILYTCLKKNITEEVKVQQLSGSVAETSAYHQGEQNLVGTITNMGQDFVGSNNINLLQPKGQFGTRLQGGDDAASGRYIFTLLSKLTKLIFRPEDEPILDAQYEEGFKIEPKRYLPIIPMVLVNGSTGIGTGWSTDIPKYNPIVLCKILLHKLTGGTKKYRLKPYYKGFVGEVVNTEDDKFISNGVWEYNAKSSSVKITELPVSVWTDNYCEFLDSLVDKKLIRDYKNSSTDVSINISVSLNKDTKLNDIQNLLKLTNKISLTNMNAFVDNSIRKFDTSEEILEFFYNERIKWYAKRKEYQLAVYKEKYRKAVQIHAFIGMINEGKIVPMGMKKTELIEKLKEFGFELVNDSYDYLLNMPIHSMTEEHMAELEKDKQQLKTEYKLLQNKTIEELWISDIEELLSQLEKQK